MNSLGLFIRYSESETTIMASPTQGTSYPLGLLPCLIFQGESYQALTRIIRNNVSIYPNAAEPFDLNALDEATKYLGQCFLYDDFRPASHLGYASFSRILKTISSYGVEEYLERLQSELEYGSNLLIPISSVTTMGDFLSLGYNYYLIDLVNGHDAFLALAAKEAGTLGDESAAVYQRFCATSKDLPPSEIKLTYDVSTQEFSAIYRVTSFEAFMSLEYMHMTNQNIRFRRCQNPKCRKFFVAQRSSAKYCNFASPQNELRTCREIYPQIANHERTTKDELQKKIRSTQSRLYNIRRRHPELSRTVNCFLDEIDASKDKMAEMVISGEKALNEFYRWLDNMKVEQQRKDD